MREIITVATEGDADAVTVFAHLDERGCTARMVLRFFKGDELVAVESIGADDMPEIAEINVDGTWDLDALSMLLDEYDTEIEAESGALSLGLAI